MLQYDFKLRRYLAPLFLLIIILMGRFCAVLQTFMKLLMAYKKLFIILILIALKSISNVSKSIKKAKHRMNEKMAYNIHHETSEKLINRKKRVASFLNFLWPYYL